MTYRIVDNTGGEEQEPNPESRKWWHVPSSVKSECKALGRRLPLVLALVLQLTFNITVTIFVGRLGEYELAGTGLALTIISFTQNGIAQGMSTACDTLFSQAFGADRKKLIGLHLQRSLMFAMIATVLVWSFYLSIETCIVTIGIEPAVAQITATYLLVYIPGVTANFMFQILSKYLIAQYIVNQVTLITVLGNLVNIGAHLLFVTYLQMGITGSAIALSLSSCSLLISILIYILVTGLYKETWTGWSLEAFHDWDIMSRYALPGIAMLSIEYVGYEMGAVMAGILGPFSLSAMTVYSQMSPFVYTIYVGLATSCSFRIGALLGAGDVAGAVRCSKVTYAAAFLISLVVMICFTAFKYQLPRIFTDDESVIELTAQMLQLYVSYTTAVAFTAQFCGVLRGCGRQTAGAAIHLIGYVVLCIPTAAALMFLTDLDILGFVIGVDVAMWVEFVLLSILIYFTDWQEQAEKAREIVQASSAGVEKSDRVPGSRVSLYRGSKIALLLSQDNLHNQKARRNELSAEYGSLITIDEFRLPRRGCSTAIFFSRAVVFALVGFVFAAAVGQKFFMEQNHRMETTTQSVLVTTI